MGGLIPEGQSILANPPPLKRSVRIWISGAWKRGYFTLYNGKPRAIVKGCPGAWRAKLWRP